MDGDVKKQKPSDEDILQEARERFQLAKDADSDNRTEALDDLKFAWNLNEYQWPSEVKKLRKGRPCLTENRLPQFIRQVVNAQRQNRPSINVSPVDSKGDPAVAKVLEGMIRHVEQYSKADLAYDTAFESAVTAGIGYFRIGTRYADDTENQQEIFIAPVENVFSVYDDPHYALPDASDRQWCFVTEWVDRKSFKATYGVEPANFAEEGQGDAFSDWCDEDRVLVAEYWRMSGDAVEQFIVTWDTVLKRSEWAGKYLPIIPVFGECKNIEGKKYRKSLIRDAKDLQRINNYWLSVETEVVALQPRAPFIGPAGAFETDADKWATANSENHAYLQYDMMDGAPPPMRAEPPQFPSAVRETRMAAIEGMKAVFGIYDASLGARSNETSGIALQERQEQGDLSTYHFLDNMTRAIRYAGNVIIDLIPKIYDTPRAIRILEPDGESAMVGVNQVFIDPRTMQERSLDLQLGKYDVVVKAGPSFQTQRQEAAKSMVELMKAAPQLMQVAGDLLMKNMDFPDADKIAERLKPQSELPPQVQQQMQEMQQMIEQGQKYVGELEQKLQMAEMEKAGKDIDKQRVQLQLDAKKAQDELMSGDTTGEEMLRLREENVKQSIELKMKDLKLLEAQLGLKVQELGTREQQLGERETGLTDREGELMNAEGGLPVDKADTVQSLRVVDVLGQLAQAMQAFTESQAQLTRVLAADKVPVRGADGKIAAVRTMLQ